MLPGIRWAAHWRSRWRHGAPSAVATLSLLAPAGLGLEINGGFIDAFVGVSRRKDAVEALQFLVSLTVTDQPRDGGGIPPLQTSRWCGPGAGDARGRLVPRRAAGGGTCLLMLVRALTLPVQVIWGRDEQDYSCRHTPTRPVTAGADARAERRRPSAAHGKGRRGEPADPGDDRVTPDLVQNYSPMQSAHGAEGHSLRRAARCARHDVTEPDFLLVGVGASFFDDETGGQAGGEAADFLRGPADFLDVLLHDACVVLARGNTGSGSRVGPAQGRQLPDDVCRMELVLLCADKLDALLLQRGADRLATTAASRESSCNSATRLAPTERDRRTARGVHIKESLRIAVCGADQLRQSRRRCHLSGCLLRGP